MKELQKFYAPTTTSSTAHNIRAARPEIGQMVRLFTGLASRLASPTPATPPTCSSPAPTTPPTSSSRPPSTPDAVRRPGALRVYFSDSVDTYEPKVEPLAPPSRSHKRWLRAVRTRSRMWTAANDANDDADHYCSDLPPGDLALLADAGILWHLHTPSSSATSSHPSPATSLTDAERQFIRDFVMTGDVSDLRVSDLYTAFNNKFGEPNLMVHMKIKPLIWKAVEDKAAGITSDSNFEISPDYNFEMPSLFSDPGFEPGDSDDDCADHP
eukprot:8849351-Heterocapsa_arctica.AAC.1